MSEPDSGTDDPEAFHERLEAIENELTDAQTESDLDDIEATLDAFATDLEEAELPEAAEPEDEEEEAPPDPREELEDRLSAARDDLDAQRGPYAEDVTGDIESAKSTVEGTEWAEEGIEELADVIDQFLDTVEDTLDADLPRSPEGAVDTLARTLNTTIEEVEAANLDPDEDTEAIATLLEATDALTSGVEDSTAFGDLPVREQLHRKGFFEPLAHYKDFPPEWSAIKVHEQERNVEMILLAFELLDSNFLEEHCIDSLRRLGDERALEPMMQLAQRRDQSAIEVLGKIGSEEPIETLSEYIEEDSNPLLQQTSLRALGEIGSEESTEAVAQQLEAEDERVRSGAARSLGMIGDARAVDPLAELLGDEATAEPVRGSAAWALVEIGTESALDALAEFEEDRSYLVSAEAKKVARPDRAA